MKLAQPMAKVNDPVDEFIKANLKRFREAARLTQAQAAELAGVPVHNLTRYENGTTGAVPATVLYQLADVYGHAVGDFYLADPPEAKSEERPVFFLRTRPGVEVDADTRARLQEIIDKANRDVRARRKK